MQLKTLVLAAMVVLTGAIALPTADAQTPPLFPPPFPWFNEPATNDMPAKTDDRKPPQVEIITSHLSRGKNVLIVEITDDSFISSRQVKYVQDGRIAYADLARDHANVYYALVNVQPPTSVVEIDVIDAAGNRAIVVNEIPVGPPAGLDEIVTRVLTLFSNIVTELTTVVGDLTGN
jgi:hypothetical protein